MRLGRRGLPVPLALQAIPVALQELQALPVQVKRERQVHRETLGLLDRKAKLALKGSQAQQEMTALQVLQALKVNRGPQERVLQVRPDPWVRLDPHPQFRRWRRFRSATSGTAQHMWLRMVAFLWQVSHASSMTRAVTTRISKGSRWWR